MYLRLHENRLIEAIPYRLAARKPADLVFCSFAREAQRTNSARFFNYSTVTKPVTVVTKWWELHPPYAQGSSIVLDGFTDRDRKIIVASRME